MILIIHCTFTTVDICPEASVAESAHLHTELWSSHTLRNHTSKVINYSILLLNPVILVKAATCMNKLEGLLAYRRLYMDKTFLLNLFFQKPAAYDWTPQQWEGLK